MAKLKITETVLRDAHQSLLATRMSMDEMRPILSEMDKIGFYSAECWGGAPAQDPRGDAEHQAPDAVQRSEHAGLPSLC